jgi:transaldolase
MLKIKIFSDGADKKSLLEMNENPLISGMTTNPSLMRKAGVTDYKPYCLDLLASIKTKPISFEVFADDFAEMKRQALEIRSWGKNVYVKIPITNSKGESSIPLIRELTQQGTQLNITALFTYDQVKETVDAVKSGAPSIVSVFAGRIADTGRDPCPLMIASQALCQNAGAHVELLWASTREAYNLIQAENCGVSIITMPPDLIKKITSFGKDLNEMSLDTIKTFKSDSEAAGFKL